MNSLEAEAATRASQMLLSSIDELLALSSEHVMELPVDELEGLCLRVRSARTGYPLVLNEVVPQEVDRLGSVLLGPVFTSREFPWPVDQEGQPMAPLCQVNLAHLPVTVSQGDGLVQVWLPQSEGGLGAPLIRMIPSTAVDDALLAPIIPSDGPIEVLLPDAADWLKDFHSELKPSRQQYIAQAAQKVGFASGDALAVQDWDEWCRLAEEYGEKYGDDVATCMQIVGFEAGRLYCSVTREHERAITKVEKLQQSLDGSDAVPNQALTQSLRKVGKAFKEWSRYLGDQDYPCLLGAFKEIQYRAAERDAPFICFEAIGGREWGDGGNAQIFYSRERGFSFDWSCL